MNNAFNWRGQPSIFTSGKSASDFNGVNTSRSNIGIASGSTFTLPNSSIYNRPPTVGPQRRAPKKKGAAHA